MYIIMGHACNGEKKQNGVHHLVLSCYISHEWAAAAAMLR